jgi:outer membrane receptor protein involved in Fe transport
MAVRIGISPWPFDSPVRADGSTPHASCAQEISERACITWPVLYALLALLTAAIPARGQDTVGVGAVRGTVTDSSDRPAADVAVCVAGTSQCDVSGADGRFAVAGVRPGTYQVEIIAPGRVGFLSPFFEVRAGLDALVDIALPAVAAIQESLTVVAPAFAFPEAIKNSAFLISSRDILGGAGALQDVSRYVQALPGVALATDDFRNDLIVRGGSPLENLFIVDNVEIPNINTFATFASAGGTVSMVDAQMIQDVTFLTGGYPAPYGNRTSSVMQITQREGDRTRLGGRATVGFAGAGVVLEGPLGRARAGSWIVSARRSFLDLVTDDVGIGGVPVLYTVNAKTTYDLSPRDRIWFINVSGADNVRLGLTEDSDLSTELSTLDIQYRGHRSATGINWQRALGTRGVGLLGLTYSQATVDQRVKDLLKDGVPPPGVPVDEQIAAGRLVFREDSSESETAVKYDLTASVAGVGDVQAGASLRRLVAEYDAESPFGTDSPFFSVPDVNPFAVQERAASYQMGAYLQDTHAFTERLSTTVGVRFDRYQFLDASTFSPRVGVDYVLTKRFSLRASYGQHTQQPFTVFLAAYPENRSLQPFRADHYVAGLAFRPEAGTRVTAEFYRKEYRDYPTSSQIPSLSLANVGDTFALRDILFPMTSSGRGAARGVEIFAERIAAADRTWHGQANLAWSSVRYAGLDGIARPGSFDYPVIANLTGTYRLGARWDLSTRVAYLAGHPYTPFDAAVSSAQRRGVYDLTRVNAARLPDYFRLDLRVDRRFTVNGRDVSVFGGVQNVTNRRNIAGYTWDRRNNVMRFNEQLGLFPILGLDWRF